MEYMVLVIYDVGDNKLRLEISRFLKRMGLTRIQRSAFVGPIRPSDKADIEAGLRRITRGWSNYNVQIYVISPALYSQRVVLSEGYTLVGEEEEEFLI